MNRKILLFVVLPLLPVWLGATVTVQYGSFLKDGTFESLDFMDSSGLRFSPSNPGLISIGYFDSDPLSLGSFSDLLSNYTSLGESSGWVSQNPGFIQPSSDYSNSTPQGETAYSFVFGGISDFSNASSASSYSVFRDSSWASFADGSATPVALVYQTLEPDTVVAGNLVPDGSNFELQAIHEPSAYATILGLLGLGYAVFCRRRRSSSTD